MGKTELLAAAAAGWRSQLIDLSGNNRLLYFKETKASFTFDSADSKMLAKLLQGDEVPLKKLFPDETAMAQAAASADTLFRKQKESLEEFSIPIAYLAIGFAGWQVEDKGTGSTSKRINSPILMAPIQLEKGSNGRDGFKVQIVEEPQLNSVLLHALRTVGISLNEDSITTELREVSDIDVVIDAFKNEASGLTGLEVRPSMVIGPFSYQKQAMVNDLEDLQVLAKSDLVSALANDQSAIEKVRTQTGSVEPSDPDYTPVEAEYLVLDADSSQSFVVNAAIAGRNLVVEGPPGTGKSQTIANVIACLVADKKTVLFVAQKRAAIEAVLHRLDTVQLSPLLLDAFLAGAGRRFISSELAKAFDNQRTVVDPDVTKLQRSLSTSRDVLVQHKDALHEEQFGWGATIHELRVMSLEVNSDISTEFRLPYKPMTAWDQNDYEEALESFVELSRLGCFTSKWTEGPFWNLITVDSSETAIELSNASLVLKNKLESISNWISEAAEAIPSSEVITASTLQEIFNVAKAHLKVMEVAPSASPWDISMGDLKRIHAAISGAREFDNGEKIGFLERFSLGRAANKALKGLDRSAQSGLVSELIESRSSNTFVPSKTAINRLDLLLEEESIVDDLAWLFENTVGLDPEAPVKNLSILVSDLATDPELSKVPRASSAYEKIKNLGLEGLYSQLVDEQNEDLMVEDQVRDYAKYVIVRSLLEAAELQTPEVSSFTGAELEKVTKDFREADTSKLAANAVRIRRLAAERLVDARNRHGDQERLVVTELTRKSKFKSINTLFREAPQVLLAAKPVWAMSPLQVSRLLPAQQLFDVVIFDEASQIRPADAMPALLRAKKALVAGDTRQLPPTDFFSKVVEVEFEVESPEPEDASLDSLVVESERPKASKTEALTADAESILFAFARLLAGQTRRLLWHYRSKDERLIAVSNAHVYDSSLTTFPAADLPNAVSHIQLAYSPGVNGSSNSPQAEVEKVVELVKLHARNVPETSLGVITFGVAHQNRIEQALDRAEKSDPALLEFRAKKGTEAFFVKSIERVQGDERDNIILSFGYGADKSGKVNLFWGPLLQPGGERRLNVAISRSKSKMILITSFGLSDLTEDRHSSAGYKLMYNFLRFCASNGEHLGSSAETIPLNAFEIDVKQRLMDAGLKIDAQVGVGSYRIDFAVKHPKKSGTYVLAVEADGASYHSGHTARERDRLRQTLLEARGWTFVRIWSTDWFRSPEREVQRVVAAYEAALKGTKATPAREKPETADWEALPTRDAAKRPKLVPGLEITQHSDRHLIELLKYIRSDQQLRTAEEEVEAMFTELGYAKRGQRIMAKLREIVSRN
jgi:very-short-patch-repair endonuclease